MTGTLLAVAALIAAVALLAAAGSLVLLAALAWQRRGDNAPSQLAAPPAATEAHPAAPAPSPSPSAAEQRLHERIDELRRSLATLTKERDEARQRAEFAERSGDVELRLSILDHEIARLHADQRPQAWGPAIARHLEQERQALRLRREMEPSE